MKWELDVSPFIYTCSQAIIQGWRNCGKYISVAMYESALYHSRDPSTRVTDTNNAIMLYATYG